MARSKMLLAFGVLALGVGLGLMASRAVAAPPCGHHACRLDQKANCPDLKGAPQRAGLKGIIAACQQCDCAFTTNSCPCSPSGAFLDE